MSESFRQETLKMAFIAVITIVCLIIITYVFFSFQYVPIVKNVSSRSSSETSSGHTIYIPSNYRCTCVDIAQIESTSQTTSSYSFTITPAMKSARTGIISKLRSRIEMLWELGTAMQLMKSLCTSGKISVPDLAKSLAIPLSRLSMPLIIPLTRASSLKAKLNVRSILIVNMPNQFTNQCIPLRASLSSSATLSMNVHKEVNLMNITNNLTYLGIKTTILTSIYTYGSTVLLSESIPSIPLLINATYQNSILTSLRIGSLESGKGVSLVLLYNMSRPLSIVKCLNGVFRDSIIPQMVLLIHQLIDKARMTVVNVSDNALAISIKGSAKTSLPNNIELSTFVKLNMELYLAKDFAIMTKFQILNFTIQVMKLGKRIYCVTLSNVSVQHNIESVS